MMNYFIEYHVNGFDWCKHITHNTEIVPAKDISATIVEVDRESPMKANVTVSVTWSGCDQPLTYVAAFIGPGEWRKGMVTSLCPEDYPRTPVA